MRSSVWSIAIPVCIFIFSLPLLAGHAEPGAACAKATPPSLQNPQSDSPIVDETFVRAALQRKLDLYPQVPGFMVAIQEPGHDPIVIAEGYARISPPSDGEDIPLVGNEYFRIASISKFYTATAIMRLREQGALSLTNTVADLAPELNAPRAEDVTVDLLLSHRSGMADAVNTPWFVNQFKQDPFRAYSLEETVSVVAHLYPNLLFEPGTDYHYSDTGYSILARIIENVSGTNYQSFLRTELLDPLGLTNTFIPFNTDYDVPEPAIAQYATVDGVFGDWSRFSPSLELGCGSIMATIHDVMRFAHEVLATTNVINPESQALMMEHGNGRGAQYLAGLGWGHGGNAWGMNSYVAVDTHSGVTVAAASNGMEYDQPQRLLNTVLAMYSGMGLIREMRGHETAGSFGAKPPFLIAPLMAGRQARDADHTVITANLATNWIVLGDLPDGLVLNANAGVISGQATTIGQYTVDIAVQNAFGSTTNQLHLFVRTGYTNTISVISEQIREIMETEGTVGASIALVDGDEIVWSEGFGYADREAGIPVTPDTVFRIGSVSKAFTSAATLQYDERGLLDIYAPFTNYVPDVHWLPRYEGARSITGVDLMTHHSGLPGDLFRTAFLTEPLGQGYENIVHDLARTYPILSPGTINNYCNIGFVLLEGVIEAAAASEGDHRSFADLVDARIFSPLGMTATSYRFDKPAITEHLAVTHLGGERMPAEFVDILGTGSMYSRPKDLAQFIMAIFNEDPVVLRPETTQLMLADHSTNALFDAFSWLRTGLGWDTVSDPRFESQEIKAAWKGGGTLAYTAMMTVLPDEKLGVAITASSISSIPSVLHTLTLQHALKERDGINLLENPERPLAAVVDPPEQAELAALAGYYVGVSEYDRVEVNENSLTLIKDVISGPIVISNLSLRADGWFASDDLPTFMIAFTNVHGRDLVLLNQIHENLDFSRILAERFTPVTGIPAAWSNRLDKRWVARNAPANDYIPLLGYGPDLYLRQENDVFYVETSGIPPTRVLEPESDTVAWVVGLLNRSDSAVQVELIDDTEHIRYAGYLFGPEPEELSTTSSISGEITQAGFSAWYAIQPAQPVQAQGNVSNVLYEVELVGAPDNFRLRLHDIDGIAILAERRSNGTLMLESSADSLLLRIQPDTDGAQAGTYEISFNVPLLIREIDTTDAGAIVWQGPAGASYTLEGATDLKEEEAFTPLGEDISTTDLLHRQPLPDSTEPMQFFRIKE